MTNPSSPIFHFYPAGKIDNLFINFVFCDILHIFLFWYYIDTFLTDFEIDMSGKKFAWQVLYHFLCIQIVFELPKG